MFDEHRELSLRDRVLAWRSLDAFSSLEDSSLILIAEHAQFRSFKKGERMLESGAVPDRIFVLLDGGARVERLGKVVAHVERGSGVGVLSVLAKDCAGVDAIAVEPTAALMLPATALIAAMEQDFALVRNSLRLTAAGILGTRGNLPRDPATASPAEPGPPLVRSMTMAERIIQFSTGPVFSNCNLDAVVELVRRSREVRYTKGDVMWSIGDPSTHSVGLDYGVVRCRESTGRHVDVGVGFAIGVMDGFAQKPRAYGAIAHTDVVGFRIDDATFMSVLESQFGLAMELVALQCAELLKGN